MLTRYVLWGIGAAISFITWLFGPPWMADKIADFLDGWGKWLYRDDWENLG